MLGLVFAGIRHRALRTVAAVLTSAVTLAVLTLTATALRRVSLIADGMPDFMAVFPANVWLQMPAALSAQLARVAGVSHVEYYASFFALPDDTDPDPVATLTAASNGYFQLSSAAMMRVDPALEQSWQHERQGLLADDGTTRKMHWSPGDQVTLIWRSPYSGQRRATPFHFLGTYQGINAEEVVGHYEYLDELLLPEERGRVSFIGAFRDAGSRAAADQAMDQLFSQVPDPIKAGPSREWVASDVSLDLEATSLLEKLGIVMLAITAVIVSTTAAMTLRQRRSEIGVLRALGLTRLRTLRVILAEALFIGACGYIIGVALPDAVMAIQGHGIDLGHGYLLDVRPGLIELLLAAAAAAALSIGSAIFPALSASRQDVIAALQEG